MIWESSGFSSLILGMGITAFYGASMEDDDAVKLLKAAYDMGYRRRIVEL